MAIRILIIEDDKDAAAYMAKGLTESGYTVDVAHDGKQGLLLAATGSHDLLIVDRMLPGLDGLSVVRTLRATGNRAPVLFLSALGEVDDRVKGLKAGGDDYLVKPYAFSELLARIEALLRRRQGKPPTGGRRFCAMPISPWICSPGGWSEPDARSICSRASSRSSKCSCAMPAR